MKMIHKLIRSVLALSMAVQLLAVPALAAEETPVYLALGDSISTGYGLASPSTDSFAEQVNSNLGYKLENYAMDGNTADGIYQQLTDPTAEKYVSEDLLADADLITITCGGNDVMNALYGILLAEYNTKNDTNLQKEDLPAIMNGTGPITIYKLALGSMSILDETVLERPECQQAIRGFEEHLSDIMHHIREHNPTARVIVTTQYNPYKVFEEKAIYKRIYEAVSPGLDPNNEKSLNYVIRTNAQQLGYVVSDVYTAFTPNSAELCNAFYDSLSKVGLDFHPNAAGHAVIAQTVLATVKSVNDNLALTPSITQADLSTGSVTVSGTGLYTSAFVAFYDADGRMIGIALQNLDPTQAQTSLTAKLHGTAVSSKVLMLSRNGLTPDCGALLWGTK